MSNVSPLNKPLSDTPAAISSLYYVLNMDEGAVEPDWSLTGCLAGCCLVITSARETKTDETAAAQSFSIQACTLTHIYQLL